MNTQRHAKASFTLIVCLILIPILSGCGAEATPEAPSAYNEESGGPVLATDMAADMGPATEAPMQEGAHADESKANQAQGTPDPGLVAALPQERMIVKNGEIDLLVESTDAAIDQVTQIATDNGGYVLSSQAAMSGIAKAATITIAVRADQFETAMRRLRQIAIEVQSELSTGEDVTSEYVDLESRQRNLEATRDRIKSFLEDAKTVDEALKINQQLSDIEAEIEQVKGRMNFLSGRSAFSTITINVQEKIDATPTLTPTPMSPWSLGPVIEDATKTQVGLAQGLLSLVTWLVIVLGPYCLASGLILWGIAVLARRKKGGRPPAPPKNES